MEHFYGYGSWQAPFWFVAYEEPGGDLPEEVAEKFNYFYELPVNSKDKLGDIRELYQRVTFRIEGPRAELFNNLHDYRFGPHSHPHGIWKNLIAFVHGYENKPVPDLLEYQREAFAMPSIQNEALITLYPLPSPHNHAWYYSWLVLPGFDFIRSRAKYEAQVYPDRIQTILQNIRTYKPEVVLMYDMNNINTLKKSVQSFFPGVQFKAVKGIKGQIPQHHRADLDGTTLLITTQTPALKHNRIETGFDWEAFARTIKPA